MKLIRVLRGVLGTAAAWSLAWIPLTLASWSIVAAIGGNVPSLRFLGAMVLGAAVRGAISGAAFATVLAVAGRRRTFETLRLRDMLLWGAVGALVSPLLSWGAIALTTSAAIPPLAIGLGLGMASAVGAISAAGTLWIARRAPALPMPVTPRVGAGIETA